MIDMFALAKTRIFHNIAAKNLINSFMDVSLFARLISHQLAVLFSQNKPATGNQPTVLFSQNKPAPAISQQPTEQAEDLTAAGT
jgi:hypothetical protein